MKNKIKIGLQIVHNDEYLTLRALLDQSQFQIYSWHFHSFDLNEIKSCDVLVLFARRHWRYLKFNKPYFLILADFVSNEKAINLTKSRNIGLIGYSYKTNNLFGGYICGSLELFEAIQNQHIKGIFYKKKYPFSNIFLDLSKNTSFTEPREIVTLINNYKSTAGEVKWRKPENSYKVYLEIAGNCKAFSFIHYGAPNNQIAFDESLSIQFNARYTIHIKYWGHVCNAVVKSLALGTPVLMDETTFLKGRYKAYLTHRHNALIFKDKNEIINYLNSSEEPKLWKSLKNTTKLEASRWHFPYSSSEKESIADLIEKHLNK